MTGLVLRGGGVEEVAAVVTEVLGGSLAVLDDAGRPLLGDVGELDAGIAEAAQTSRTLGRTVRRGNLLVASVDVAGEPLCTLVLRTPGVVADTDQPIVDRAALVTALLLLFRRSVAEAEGRVRGELLDDLISRPVVDPEALAARARRVGVDLAAPYVIVVARHDGQRERAAFWASSHATIAHGLAAVRGEEVVLMLPGDKPGHLARRAVTDLMAALGGVATAGASGPVRGPAEVAAAYQEAQRCAEALVALGRAGDGAGAAELGFVGLLIGDGPDVGGFLHATLGPVLDYDARRGTALVSTLSAYFGCGGSLSRTAEALHIHVNTVTQRLDRVGQLLGSDWQAPDRALEIQLALRLNRLAGRPHAG